MNKSQGVTATQQSLAALLAAHGLKYGIAKAHQPAKFELNKGYPFTTQLSHMLQLQERMNRDTAPHWRTAGFAWMRAAMVEGVEGLCHYDSWKWWKKGKPDLKQAMFELVDIWHFNLSWYMVRFERFGHDDETLLTAIVRRVVEAAHQLSLKPEPVDKDEAVNKAFEKLVGAAVSGVPDLNAFIELCVLLELSLDDLYKGYLQKNLLNFFRQKYGYKTGTYLKNWKGGLEDNVYLDTAYAEIVKTLDFGSPTAIPELEKRLWDALTAHYTEACEGHYCLTAEGKGHVIGTKDSFGRFLTLAGVPITVSERDTLRPLPIAEK